MVEISERVDGRRDALLQECVNVLLGILWNMRHAGEHQNANIRLDPLHHCSHIITIALGHQVVEEN